MKFLKEKLLLSEKGYSDLKKAIVACTLTNIALLLRSVYKELHADHETGAADNK